MRIIRAIGILILIAAAAALTYQYSRNWATLRAAVPPLGAAGQRMLQDLSREGAKESTWLTMRRIAVADPAAAAAAIEKGEADVAVVRSDVAMPRNGRSIAVFQTLYAFLIVPPRSAIDDFKSLKDRTIAVVPDNQANEKLLDLILDHHGVPRASVRRTPMKPEEVGPALQQRKIVAAFVVGPVGGAAAETFQSVQKAMKGTPKVFGVEDAEAIHRLAVGVDATEVSKGVFGGSPAQPEDDLTTIGVTMRMVVPAKMSSMAAGELTRVLFEAKAKAVTASPHMREMQEPDSDNKDYPIHPAAQAYFDGEAPTFMDRFESFFWLGWALVGLLGSLAGWIVSKVSQPKKNAIAEHFDNLLGFLDEVRQADLKKLDELQARIDKAVGRLFDQREDETLTADAVAIYSIAIDYARAMIVERRAQLLQQPAPA
ncbi:MAG: TAXI family TRAP transporter solute-binding subunit [Beijerinckiaceae bacterium]